MKKIFSKQKWYKNNIFKLLETHKERYMPHFGTDCTFLNIENWETINYFDSVMEKLSPEEQRDAKLHEILEL